MTTRGCAGTPARAFSTAIRTCGRTEDLRELEMLE